MWTRPPSDAERFIYVADDKKVAVEAVGTSDYVLRLDYFWIYLRRFMYRHLDGI